ncbi:transcription factor S [Methanobrevibacter millerae]|uniref:Transcription factor S n=1 Tax=Methanobrevibacter millerae TaxID=230361 RepID=A0A1G5W212_9EURY|nr:transcription factor S [Methanobrevibacter millerae]SDA52149.1 DNA-directed RNA polymerase subunit M [Methanobrevibacter millerae]
MEFCPECGAMLLPNDNKLKCACGYTKDLASDNNEYSVHQEVKGKQGVVDMGEAIDLRSKITEICPECGHNEAYYELKQTRSADEAPTRFFECASCGHKWRDYD